MLAKRWQEIAHKHIRYAAENSGYTVTTLVREANRRNRQNGGRDTILRCNFYNPNSPEVHPQIFLIALDLIRGELEKLNVANIPAIERQLSHIIATPIERKRKARPAAVRI